MTQTDAIDNAKTKLYADISGTITRLLPDGVREGSEWVAINPTRADSKRGSFKVNLTTGRWSDFATNDSGDLLDLVAYVQRKTVKDVLQDLDATPMPLPASKPVEKKPAWTVLPVAATPPPENIVHPTHGKPNAIYDWCNQAGELLGFTCRFDLADGEKLVLPFTCAENSGFFLWMWKSWEKPRPLYGLPALSEKPTAPVLIVEGEKCRDAAALALPNFAVLTWPGGCKAVALADWSHLEGRDVTIWPDADEPGILAAKSIQKKVPGAKILTLPDGLEKGYDVADAIKDGRNLDEFFVPKIETKKRVLRPCERVGIPFKMLGAFEGSYYFFTNSAIVSLSTPQLGQTTQLLSIANLSFWEDNFPGSKSPVNWLNAQNYLLEWARTLPDFNSTRVRGRGAWLDAGRAVVHLGDRLIVDGKETALGEIDSDHFYPKREKLSLEITAPGSVNDGQNLADIFLKAQWDDPRFAQLATGWLFIAPVIGALRWRPHIWITGGRGTGKSWLMNNVFTKYLGPIALIAQGDTTEAGLRQQLDGEARPIIFDELEPRDKKSRDRIANILGLLRIASTDSTASVTKGSPSGKHSTYHVRTAACCASIDVSAQQSADTSRFTILSMTAKNSRDDFDTLSRTVREVLTTDFCSRLHARAFASILRIRDLVETFTRVGATVLGDQRLADQVGTLFAGFWCACYDHEPTDAEAATFFERKETLKDESDEGDEQQCLSWLLSSSIRAEGVSNYIAIADRPISELLEQALQLTENRNSDAVKALRRIGIVIANDRASFWVSGKNPSLAKIYHGKPWTRWAAVLARLPGAQKKQRDSNGTMELGVSIPFNILKPL